MAEAIHQRRAGTAGFAGQLYEIKTAMLALLNAQLARKRGDIDKFWLGTNVDGLGAADDIVMKCTTQGREKISFVQCKHRENSKHKVTLGDALKEEGDFALVNLVDSYFSIMNKCGTRDDVVLKDAYEDIEIVMYTPAETNFGDAAEEVNIGKDDFILTNEEGKVLQFKTSGEHINTLLESMSQSHAKSLTKLLAGLVLSYNGDNLMTNYLAQIYHVYLREHVLQVSNSAEQNIRKVKFRPEFFNSRDPLILRLRKYLCNEILMSHKHSKITKVNSQELDVIFNAISVKLSCNEIKMLRNKSTKEELFINELRAKLKESQVTSSAVDKILTEIIIKRLCDMQAIRVPVTFGNMDLEVRKDRRLDHLGKQIVKMLQNCEITNNRVKVESRHVGRDRLLTKGDVQVNGGIGGLVGNLFVLDEETDLLKLNTDENSLPANAKKLLIKLKDTISKEGLNLNLSSYRFQFNIFAFPRILWNDKEADTKLLTDFLSKFKFYSGQAKEDIMDVTIKEKLLQYYNADINTERTFLHIKNQIETWWRKKYRVKYLTETCDYFDEVDKPDLLHMFRFIHTNEVDRQDVVFSATALQSLGIGHFISHSEHRMLCIITDNLTLTTIKVLQYFKSNDNLYYNYSVIDMQYVLLNNLYDDMLHELEGTHIKNIIIKLTEFDNKFYSLCNDVQDSKKRLVVITEKKNFELRNCIRDERNTFNDLSQESQKKILDNTRVLFQDEEINLQELLINEECHSLVDVNVLDEIISKGRIAIGKPLIDEKYNIIKDSYIIRKLHRCVTIKKEYIANDSKLNEEKMNNLLFTYSKHMDKSTIGQCQDILLVSDDVKDFEELCTQHGPCVHWFQKIYNHYIWKQSRGSLSNICNYVDRAERSGDSRLLNTMADVEDKTVIIAAGPGMGKTSLLTHLSIAAKKMCPTTWIVRINLLDYSINFDNWKNSNKKIDKEEAFSFLTKVIASTSLKTSLSIFEQRLFDQYYRNGKVVLIFDGYDEISPDYSDQVIELLVNSNTAMIKQMWVATRPYDIQRELENRLGAFCYTLAPLSKYEQKRFLQKYCRGQSTLANVVFQNIDPEIQTVLATPLHLSMIVKISENQNEGLINTMRDLYKLYKQFIDIKIKEIYIREKSQLYNERNSNQRRMIDKECRDVILNHKMLGVAAVFHKEDMLRILDERERETLNELIERIKNGEEKAGIVDRVVDGAPRFVHITFAEYFVVEYFCDKLKSGIFPDIIWSLLLYNRNVRRMFDAKIANDACLAKLGANYDFSKIFLGFSRDEHKLLLLNIAMQENLNYIVNFYSKLINNFLHEDNLHIIILFTNNYQLFENAFKHNHMRFVLDMLDTPAFENTQRVFVKRTKLLVHILACAVQCVDNYYETAGFTSILDKIIRKGFQLEEILIFIFSDNTNPYILLRGVLIKDHFNILSPYLADLSEEQLVRVATASGSDGWTPVLMAADIQSYEFLHYLMKRLNKTNFRMICFTANNFKQTSKFVMSFLKLLRDRRLVNDYSSLCKYICPSDDEDEAEFDEDCLRNMYAVAATCKCLFNGDAGWFIARMLREVQHYCNSSNEDDVHFGTELLYHAVASNNETVIRALLQNVKDADRIMEIMMTKCDNNLAILQNIVRRDVDISFLPLELLSPEQLVHFVSTANSFKFFIKHLNAMSSDLFIYSARQKDRGRV